MGQDSDYKRSSDEGTTTIHVSGVEQFRKFALFVSLVFSVISLILDGIVDESGCEAVNIKIPLTIASSVHISIFVLLLMHFIKLGKCINACGRAIGLYYLYLIGAMITVQIYMFKAEECNRTVPIQYLWLIINVVGFYVFIAYGLSLWGAYICWEMEEEENEEQEAMEQYMNSQKAKDDENLKLLNQADSVPTAFDG